MKTTQAELDPAAMHAADAPRSTRSTYDCDLALRASLLAFRDDSAGHWSNATIAKETGYSTRVVADYLNPDGNKYDGDTKAVEKRIREFLRDRKLVSDSNVETVDCDIAQQICAAIEDIRTARRIGVIIGPPGIGKSRGIKLYCCGDGGECRQHEAAIAFTVWEGECNKTAVANLLFKAADVLQSRKHDNKIKALAEALDGSGRIIIPDDAHKLSAHALQMLYDFRDRAGVPIALVGDERLEAKLKADGQRLRRTGAVWRLKVKDPLPLVTHHVDQLIPNADDERQDIIALALQIAVEKRTEVNEGRAKTRYLPKEGVFGSVQMELSLATRIKAAKPSLSWCEAIRSAHKRLIRKTPLLD